MLQLRFAPLALAVLAPAAAPQSGATHWSHQLVLFDDFEDFWADGAASAYRAEINVEAPVSIVVGRIEGSNDPTDVQLAAHREWLNGWYESAPISVDGGFEQALLSWNLEHPKGTGACVELRVRATGDAPWSEWLYVGEWGEVIPPPIYVRSAEPGGPRVEPEAPKRVEIDGAKIDVDYFTSERLWSQAQFRVRTDCAEWAQDRRVRLRRFAICFSRKTEAGAPTFELPEGAVRRLAVPFRSQRTERAEIAGRICSPASVAMAMEFRGVATPTGDAAERMYDRVHDIYGNWTHAVQGAYSFGVPGYLTRFSDWNAVARSVSDGTPLVISIAAGEGELDGAPYSKTDGHLLVLCGFDEQGNLHVNDPAASTPQTGQLVYRRDQLEKVWMQRGGTAYVFLPPDKR